MPVCCIYKYGECTQKEQESRKRHQLCFPFPFTHEEKIRKLQIDVCPGNFILILKVVAPGNPALNFDASGFSVDFGRGSTFHIIRLVFSSAHLLADAPSAMGMHIQAKLIRAYVTCSNLTHICIKADNNYNALVMENM